MFPENLEGMGERLAMINYWSWVMGTFMSVGNNKKFVWKKSFSVYLKSSK